VKIILHEELVMSLFLYQVKFISQFYIKRKRERERDAFFFQLA